MGILYSIQHRKFMVLEQTLEPILELVAKLLQMVRPMVLWWILGRMV